MGFGRKFNFLNLQGVRAEDIRNSGWDNLRGIRLGFFTSNKEIGRSFEFTVKGSRNSTLVRVKFAREHIDSNVVRFEEGAHAIVVELRDRIEFVVMAFGAIHRDA